MRNLFRLFCAGAVLLSATAWAGTLAQFRTPLGDIEVELYDARKPETVKNFIRYVNSGAYDDSFMHRWEPGFVLQGGGFRVADRQQTNAEITAISTFGPITNEYGVGRVYSNAYGTIAMARAAGQTNSATSQWFFNLAHNAALDEIDGGFTVFGRVVRGTNVLNRFNVTTPENGIFIADLGSPFNNLPLLAFNADLDDLVYVDVTLLNVQVASGAGGAPMISWQSVSNRVNRVEFTTEFPPVWTELVSTNGTGSRIEVSDPGSEAGRRFYRVRVEY